MGLVSLLYKFKKVKRFELNYKDLTLLFRLSSDLLNILCEKMHEY